MWTILAAVATALYVVTEFEPWGLRTFGLLGWWAMAPVVAVVCGLAISVVDHMLRRLLRDVES